MSWGTVPLVVLGALAAKIIVSWCSLEEFLIAVSNISAQKKWLLLSSLISGVNRRRIKEEGFPPLSLVSYVMGLSECIA